MWFFWDFFSTLFHGGKTQSRNTASENAKTNPENVEYWKINWEVVQIVEDETRWEKWANAILNAPQTIWTYWNQLIWDQLTSKQDVDDQLMWLKYNWNATTDAEKAEYVRRLSDYQRLNSLTEMTIDQAVQKQKLSNELDKYTVPDTMSNGKMDWSWFLWYDTFFWRLFRSDRSREESVLEDKDAKRVPVDKDKILDSLNEWNWRTWNYFWASDPKKPIDDSMRVLTESQYKSERSKSDIDVAINDLIKTKAQEAIDSYFIAPWNPWWRKSTMDEMLWLFEAAQQDRAISTNLEAYKELYAEIKWKAPELEEYTKQKAVDMVDMMTYILTTNKDSQDAYKEYLETHDNPFEFDVAKLDYSKLNNYEKALLYANPMTTLRVSEDAIWLWEEVWWSPVDWYYTANSILRAAKLWENVKDVDLIWAWWNTLEYVWAAVWWLISSAFWTVLAVWNTWADMLSKWELHISDYNSYLFWWQSSSIYNLKANYQQEWAYPDYFWSDLSYVARQYWSIVDDLVSARFIAKLDFPVKAADLAMVNKVLVKWWKALEKAADATVKTAKAVDKVSDVATTSNKIVTTSEKVNKIIKADTFLWRVKNSISKIITKDETVREAKKAVQLSTKDSILLSWKNIVNWMADEMVSSAIFQWMTPYEYSEEDMSMDLLWAVFSWLLRIKAYNNRMWAFKMNAVDSVWTQWYLTEVKWIDPAEVTEYMWQMDKWAINRLWAAIKSTFSKVLDVDTVISKQDVKSKANLIWDDSRNTINKLISDTVSSSEQRFLKEIAWSMDPSITKYVKKGKVTNLDWTVTSWLVWNKPKWMKESTWKKTKRKIREKVYSPKGLNDINTIKGRSNILNKMKKYVKEQLPAMAARWSETTRKWVKKGADWKWTWDYTKVSKAQIDKFYADRLQRFIDKSPYASVLTVKWSKLLEKWETRKWFSAIDYINNPNWPYSWRFVWPYAQRLAMYINDQIKWKQLNKNNLIDWLAVLWAWTQKVFKRWIKERFWITDAAALSKKELISYIEEFWHSLDEVIFPDYVRRWEMRQAGMDVLSDDKKYLSNRTYQDACDSSKWWNEDLKYMAPEMFHEIANSNLSLIQKEIKLRWFKRRLVNNKNIYWLTPWSKVWVNVFWDTLEEKVLFWTKWKIYIKTDQKWAYDVINSRAWKKAYQIPEFNRKWEWVKEFDYKLEEIDPETWRRTYSIYKWDMIAWYVYTKWDYNVEWSPNATQKYWTPRNMTIVLFDIATDWEYKSVELDVVKEKWNHETIMKYDMTEKLPASKQTVTEKFFDTEIWKEVPETTLHQWNQFSNYIRQWHKSYSDFTKLVPWYTDKVPETIFDYVIDSSEWSDSDKMNFLIWVMFNKSLSETIDWYRFDLTKKKQFNRPWYRYPTIDRKTWEQKQVVVSSDAEVFYTSFVENWIAAIVKVDWQDAWEIFYYKASKNPMELDLYRSPEDKKPVGVISFWTDRVRWYFNEPWWRRMITWSVEFLTTKDKNAIALAYSRRYWQQTWTIIIWKWDELYKEIYKEIFDQEMPDVEYHRIRSTVNMTPRRYLESLIDDYKRAHQEFWNFITIRWWRWKSVVNQFKNEKAKVDLCEGYMWLFRDTTELTHSEIYRAVEEYIDRLKKSPDWKIVLSKAENEVKQIMYWNLSQYWANNMINILWYQMFWKNPPSNLWETDINKRLKNRRDTILLAIYKNRDTVNSWSEAEKSAIIWRLKRKLGKDIYWWRDVALEDIIADIEKHPNEYNSIIDALSRKIDYEEKLKEKADKKNMKIISDAEKRIEQIEKDLWIWKPIKKKWKNTDKISMNNYLAQRDFLANRLQTLISEKEEIANLENPDPKAMEDVNRRIDAVILAQRELQENISYIQWKKAWEFTDEEYKYLANAQLRWEWVFEPWTMTNAEMNARVQELSDMVPSMRVIEYSEVSWEPQRRWLTNSERATYRETLSDAAYYIHNWHARAEHLAELHAIVIDPNNVNVFDLSHETFHEAVTMMTDQTRRYEVYNETYQKFKKQIEEFWDRRRYNEQFAKDPDMDELTRQHKLTEEWLAERFWEYVLWRLELEDSTILWFFKELWNKIKLMFSDTKALELFEDIYERRLEYNTTKIDLEPSDMKADPNFRLTKDSTFDYVNNWNFVMWDDFDPYELIRNVWYRDAAILTNNRFSWRWNYFTSKKQIITLDDWRQINASYWELFEWIMTKSKELWIENSLEFLYWDDWEFFNWISNKWNSLIKTKVIWNWSAILEVTYPDVFDWSRVAEFKMIIPNWWRWNKSFIIEWIRNKTIEEIAQILAWKEYWNIIRAFETRSLWAEEKQMSNMPVWEYENYVRSMWPNYERFLNRYMPDALEKSVDEYVHWVRDASFDSYENIDQIESILNWAFRTLIFDWNIPHTNWAVNWSLVDIYQWLYRRKWERTKWLINAVLELNDPKLRFEVWRSRWITPTIQFQFKDKKWKVRSIWWHLTEEQLAEWKANWWWKYWSIDDLQKASPRKMNAPAWNRSMLIDPEWIDYNNVAVVWKQAYEKVREARWYKVPISFRDWHFNYQIWWVAFDIDWSKWFVIQKNMRREDFISALENRWWISSSIAISDSYIPNSEFWSVALLWRKRPLKLEKLFDWLKIFWWDAFTPTLHTLIKWDIKMVLSDAYKKYLEAWTDFESRKHILWELREELNKKLKPYFSAYDDNVFLDSSLKDNRTDKMIVKFMMRWDRVNLLWNHEWDKYYSWVVNSALYKWKMKPKWDWVISKMINDLDYMNRVYDDALWWQMAWVAWSFSDDDPLYVELKKIDSKDIELQERLSSQLPRLHRWETPTTLWEVDVDRIAKELRQSPNWNKIRKVYLENRLRPDDTLEDYIRSYIISYQVKQCFNYFEWYSRQLNLNDYWWIVTNEIDHDTIIKWLEDNNYKYYVIDANKWYTAEEMESIIDKYANKKDSFIVIRWWSSRNVRDWIYGMQDYQYVNPIWTTVEWFKTARQIPLIDRRSYLWAQLSDRTLKLLHAHWLDAPIIWVSTNKYINNMRDINKVLSENNYNMKTDAPWYYKENRELVKTKLVRDKQTWANSKRRILNKEIRDLQRKIRYAQERLEISQERFDQFSNSPAYFQALKIKEAIEKWKKARKALLDARKNDNILTPISANSVTDTTRPNIIKTTETTPPFAKDVVLDNYVQIDNEVMMSAMETRWTNIDDWMHIKEKQLIWWKVDIALPVWQTSIWDVNLLDMKVRWSKSFAIWATDSDVLDKFKTRISQEMPEYSFIYEREWWNIAYYKLNDDIDVDLEKQIEDDKNITEASLWSVIDSSLVCKV